MGTLILGGSFNPIHHGHLICARAAAEFGGFDRVALIPSGQPPHKPNTTDLAPATDRLAMCRLAVEGSAFFAVEDLEIRRNGPSYTIDTARELRHRGWPAVHWLIGADQLPQLPTWHEAAKLLQKVSFVVMARPGWVIDWDSLSPPYQALRHNLAPAPLIDISSTTLRARVAAGQAIDNFVPAAVARYIAGRGLYRSKSSRN